MFGGDDEAFRNNVNGATRGSVALANNGTVTFNIPVTNNADWSLAGNTVFFQKAFVQSSSGAMSMAGGTIKVDTGAAFLLAAGDLDGHGTIDGNFSHSGGRVHFSGTTTLHVTGTYTQGAAAHLDYIFADGWGKLQVDKSATLTGVFDFDVQMGTPTGWYDIVTAAEGFTDPAPGAPTGYEFDQTATAMRQRKT